MFNPQGLEGVDHARQRRSSGLSLCDCSHPNTWNVGWVKGVTSFALVVCSLRAVWIFSMNNFLIHKFRIKKCILLIKLMFYNNNQRFYLPKDAITLMQRVCVWTSGHSLHTHLHHTGYSRLYGTLEDWLADRPWTKPPLS